LVGRRQVEDAFTLQGKEVLAVVTIQHSSSVWVSCSTGRATTLHIAIVLLFFFSFDATYVFARFHSDLNGSPCKRVFSTRQLPELQQVQKSRQGVVRVHACDLSSRAQRRENRLRSAVVLASLISLSLKFALPPPDW
jgi:hypothetical protein